MNIILILALIGALYLFFNFFTFLLATMLAFVGAFVIVLLLVIFFCVVMDIASSKKDKENQ